MNKSQELCSPFTEALIKWTITAISKNKDYALMAPYIDARDVAERLDLVFGAINWQVDHKEVAGQTLTGIGIRGEDKWWVWKWDVGVVTGKTGTASDDRMVSIKGSLSDGLKRAAVLWGIGRYLKRVTGIWVGYDPQKKKITSNPALPSWALPDAERKKQRPASKPHVPINQEIEQDTKEIDPEGPPPEQIKSNGNGVGDDPASQYFYMARSLGLDRKASTDILDAAGDYGAATKILIEQHTPPGAAR